MVAVAAAGSVLGRSQITLCSSIIDAIFTIVPSTVESNWKSNGHKTFGASASTWGASCRGSLRILPAQR